jgi:hypothetical protein
MAQKKPSSYSGQPALKKFTPADASGKGRAGSQPKLLKHTTGTVSGTGARSLRHPNDQRGQG